MNIKLKVETAFKAYLKPLTKSGKALAKVDLTGAHKDGERVLPAIELWAGTAKEREDIPPGSGEYDVELLIRFLTQADDETRKREDERIEALAALMCDVDAIKTLMNYPNGRRPVPALYIQDVIEQDRTSTVGDRSFVEEMEYLIVCRNDDGQGS